MQMIFAIVLAWSILTVWWVIEGDKDERPRDISSNSIPERTND